MQSLKNLKTLMYLLAVVINSSTSNAQELIGKLYKTKVPILVRKASPNERLNTDSADKNNNLWQYCEAKKGYIFQVVDVKDKTVLIRWWNFSDSSAARQERKNNFTGANGLELISHRNTHYDYEISLTDLNAKCVPYYGNDNSFTWGAITMPVKLRLGNRSDKYFSFQESLNIGIAAGWRWQKQGIYQRSNNILFSLGVSNVALDSLDFKRNAKNEHFQPSVKSTLAITISAGYVFQFENFQVGAFTGLDFLPYEIGRQWLHRGKPWIGIGLGMSLFGRNQQSAGSGKNEEKKQ